MKSPFRSVFLLFLAFCCAVAVFEFSVRDAKSAEPPVCSDLSQSLGHIIHNAAVHIPDLVVERFTGSDAQAGILIYNHYPPVGDDAGDTFVIGIAQSQPSAWLAIAKGDCVVTNMGVSKHDGVMILQAILRARSQSGAPL